MPGRRGKAILAGGVALVALVFASCGEEGGGDEIPQPAADQMLTRIGEIEQATANEDCDTAQAATTDLGHQVDALEDSGTKDALREMIDRLDENLDEECPPGGTTDEEVEPEPEITTEPVEPTTTTTTTTEPDEDEGQGPPEEPPGQAGKPPKPEKPDDSGNTEPPTGGTEGEDD